MPRASDVDRDMTNGERIEVKFALPFLGTRMTADESRVSEAKTSHQAKKIVIPGVVSTLTLYPRLDQELISSYSHLDGMLYLRHSLQQ